MNAPLAFLRRHALATYFTLVFVLSWGGVLLVIGGPTGLPATPEESDRLFPAVYVAMLLGPSLASLLASLILNGRAGFQVLHNRLTHWRVAARWYAVALLTAPLLTTAVLLALSKRSPEFVPEILGSGQRGQTLVFAVLVGLGAGVFEELGWTGFAIPRLRLRHGVLASGLFLGVVWGAWHILVNLWASATPSGEISLVFLLPVLLSSVGLGMLPVYRVLMVWVHDRTDSLPVAILMHASLTTSLIALRPAATGASLATYELVWAGTLWAILAGIAAFDRRWQFGVSAPRPSARHRPARHGNASPREPEGHPPAGPARRTAGVHAPRT